MSAITSQRNADAVGIRSCRRLPNSTGRKEGLLVVAFANLLMSLEPPLPQHPHTLDHSSRPHPLSTSPPPSYSSHLNAPPPPTPLITQHDLIPTPPPFSYSSHLNAPLPQLPRSLNTTPSLSFLLLTIPIT
ncbi:hypothetical protein Pcinc_007690 [Petrolisthes cinctipes]|uniref:Uncharacterized protein n=1 Tax=Petrolisthes cinctipes TaxID=88211 RepID=A0AAE1KXY3_PETCI|nr:hypothetical protein Pcinc_007690 [Petrolisthes cinctipes]